MSQLNGYLEALLPKPVTVLGFTLKPFSLGHLNLVQRMGAASFINGFNSSPESIVKYTSDFLTTVLICAMTYEEAKEAFDADTVTLRIQRKKKDGTFIEQYSKSSFSEYVSKWNTEIEKACKKDTINILQEITIMQEYIKDAFAGPETYPIDDDNSHTYKSGAPWEQALREFLLTKHSESEAMNMPLSLAFWEWNKEAENNRQLGIKSEEDVTAIELLKSLIGKE